MNMETIKTMLANSEYDHDNDGGASVRYLLSIIEQKDAELTKATKIIKFQVERNDKQRKNYFEQEAIILQVEKTLKLIANGNNDFPSWGDAVDILKDVRLLAKEELQAIRG